MIYSVSRRARASRKEIYPAVAGAMFALIPIVSPYSIKLGSFDLSFSYAIIIALSFGAILSRRRSRFSQAGCAIALAGILLICTLVSFCLSIPNRSIGIALRVAMTFIVISILYWESYQTDCVQYFVKAAYVIAALASALSFCQLIFMGTLGMTIWDGVLPFPVTNQDSFQDLYDQGMGVFRPRSFFQEVSYLAIYLAPVFLHSLTRKKWAYALLFGATLAVSASFLGIAVLALGCIIAMKQITTSGLRVHWGKIALVVSGLFFVGLTIAAIYISSASPTLESFINLVLRRIESVAELFVNYEWGRSSAQLRLLGNIELFGMYTPQETLVGVGMDQYSMVFSSYVTTSYGSALVNILLNCGLIGAVSLIVMVVRLGLKGGVSALPFVAVFTLCLISDNIVFDAKFFYLLSWVLIAISVCPSRGFSRQNVLRNLPSTGIEPRLTVEGAYRESYRVD